MAGSDGAPQARQLWAKIGTDFFRALVSFLPEALGASQAYIGEVLLKPAEKVKILAASGDGTLEGFEYALSGTASSETLSRGTYVHSPAVRQSFPADPVLAETGANAYAGAALFDTGGRPVGIVGVLYRSPIENSGSAEEVLRAIAPRAAAEVERKREDDALRESEQRYRAFIAQSADAMWRVEFDKPIPIDLAEDDQIDRLVRYGYIAECNDATARILGLANHGGELLGARLGDFVPRIDRQLVEELRSWIRSGYHLDSVEIQTTSLEGKPSYRLRSLWGIVENGRLCRAWGRTRDIGDLRRAELEWQASERRFRDLLENVRMAAVMLDTEGQITFCNDYLLKLTGWPREDVIGRNWFDLLTPEEDRQSLREMFAGVVSGSRPVHHLECPLLTRSGARRQMEWDNTALYDSRGNIAGQAGLGRDITEYRALEAQFRQVQKLESVGRVAGGVAHDFNNLLTIISSYADILLSAHGSGDPLHDAAEEIRRAGERGCELTRQLLLFSRKQRPEARVLNLNDIIAEDQSMLRCVLGDDVELIVSLEPSLRSVFADPGHLHQVLMNLAVNARDAMPRGGKLFIASANLEPEECDVAGKPGIPPNQYAMLTVTDTGVGMSEEVKARLFEPFFTTKEPGRGTGLGLSTVYGIISQAGGHILVSSEPGRGATFRIVLPAVSAKIPPEQPSAAAAAPRGTETILVVENDEGVRTLVSSVLQGLGYRVLEAGSGSEALSVCERHAGPVQLLLTDIAMPGMSGEELARRMTQMRSGLRVLYMSGAPAHQQPCVQKPFSLQTLAAKVREALGPAA